uniref:KRAB domain-containing protein n=1 Tax=Peromyscus maniculatus bairdii TaxID=230844 RepID=A0A8C8W613_PERMB
FDARRYLMGRKRPYQSLVPFEDVIMCFSGEEWKHLTMTQTLYAEVTMENIALTSSMCYQCAVEDEEIPCEQVSEKPRMGMLSFEQVMFHLPDGSFENEIICFT